MNINKKKLEADRDKWYSNGEFYIGTDRERAVMASYILSCMEDHVLESQKKVEPTPCPACGFTDCHGEFCPCLGETDSECEALVGITDDMKKTLKYTENPREYKYREALEEIQKRYYDVSFNNKAELAEHMHAIGALACKSLKDAR